MTKEDHTLPRLAELRERQYIPAEFEKNKEGIKSYTKKVEGTGCWVDLDPSIVIVHAFVTSGETGEGCELYAAGVCEHTSGRLSEEPVNLLTLKEIKK